MGVRGWESGRVLRPRITIDYGNASGCWALKTIPHMRVILTSQKYWKLGISPEVDVKHLPIVF